MSNKNVTTGSDGIPEVTVAAQTLFNGHDIRKILNHNLLRSCKFAFRLMRHPNCSSFRSSRTADFTFLCDAIELPGRSITTLEYLIPGLQKIKTPYRRDYNEITLSFYHNDQLRIFEYFNDWVDQMSTTTTSNRYFDEIVTDLELVQYLDTENFSRDHEKYMTVKIKNAFPISVSSLPCNWADDGFHKLSVSMFYEIVNDADNFREVEVKDPFSTARRVVRERI